MADCRIILPPCHEHSFGVMHSQFFLGQLLCLSDQFTIAEGRNERPYSIHWSETAGSFFGWTGDINGTIRSPFGNEPWKHSILCAAHNKMRIIEEGSFYSLSSLYFGGTCGGVSLDACIKNILIIEDLLGLLSNPVHVLDALDRVLSSGGLSRKHSSVGQVKYCISDVRCFCPRRDGLFLHGIHHLSGCNSKFAMFQTSFEDELLSRNGFLHGDFHTQISPGNHQPITLSNHVVQVVDSFMVFYLRYDHYVFSFYAHQFA